MMHVTLQPPVAPEMPYHVVYSFPEVAIHEGPGDDPEATFETFEEARDAAITDLEQWTRTIQGGLNDLLNAETIDDLPRNK